MMNDRIYNTDRKKIIFALSFMKDGVAEIWKQHTAENATFGTWEEFKDTLKKSFTPANKEGDAITKMQTASMTGKTAEKRVCDKRRKCERLWSELYKHLKHPTTLSTIKFKGGRDNPL